MPGAISRGLKNPSWLRLLSQRSMGQKWSHGTPTTPGGYKTTGWAKLGLLMLFQLAALQVRSRDATFFRSFLGISTVAKFSGDISCRSRAFFFSAAYLVDRRMVRRLAVERGDRRLLRRSQHTNDWGLTRRRQTSERERERKKKKRERERWSSRPREACS